MNNPYVARYWNPDAPSCTPGPYGGYYDAAGNLHCKAVNMPTDDKGYPLISPTRPNVAPDVSPTKKNSHTMKKPPASPPAAPPTSPTSTGLPSEELLNF